MQITYIYDWIYENGAKEFAPEKAGGDIKIKGKPVLFFSSSRLSSFYCCPSPPCFPLLLGLEAAFRSCEIKVNYG